MEKKRTRQLATALILGLSIFSVVGCRKDDGPRDSAANRSKPEGAKAVVSDNEFTAKTAKSGAQLWAANCTSCHRMRPPQIYSDDEWEIAVNHMRVRAGLTTNDARKITEFLKAGN